MNLLGVSITLGVGFILMSVVAQYYKAQYLNQCRWIDEIVAILEDPEQGTGSGGSGND